MRRDEVDVFHFFWLVHHNLSKKDIDTQARKKYRQDDFKLKIIIEILSDPLKTFQIILSPLEHFMARLGKAVDLIDEASSLVRGSQVISSDLVAKAQTGRSRGIFIVTYKIYIYMASFLPPKTWGRFPEEHPFFKWVVQLG